VARPTSLRALNAGEGVGASVHPAVVLGHLGLPQNISDPRGCQLQHSGHQPECPYALKAAETRGCSPTLATGQQA